MCKGSQKADPAHLKDKQLDNEIRAGVKQDRRFIKLLLLGAGESGKSTIAKQLRVCYASGYTPAEIASYRLAIFDNTCLQMQALIMAANERNHPLQHPEIATKLMDFEDTANFNAEVAGWVKTLWGDSGIQATFRERNLFQLNDSAQYFFEAVDRTSKPDFTPDNEDIIRVRVPTTGVIEIAFSIGEANFRLFDVGGQRNERRKWIHCFDDVTAVMFVAALSEYDQVLYEDDNQNRMQESLQLFAEICNNRHFLNTSMILFLNKRDLFQQKLTTSPLSSVFPEYKGGPDYDEGCKFIANMFMERNEAPEKRTVYVHLTCATDNGNVKFVFEAVKDILMQKFLAGSGFA